MLESNKLNEQVTSADIASYEFWLNVRDHFQQTQIPSLAHSLLANYTMKTPVGKVFNLTDEDSDKDNDIDLKLIANTVEATSIGPYCVEITQEALQDYTCMYDNPSSAIAESLKGFTNRKESEDVINMFSKHAVEIPALSLSDAKNAETQMFELTQKIQSCILQMNSKHLRTYYGFAVLPYKYASSIMTTYAYTTGKDTADPSELLVAKIGTVSYYVNPKLDDNYVYVGLRHPSNKGLCSGVYGEYQNNITHSINPDTGDVSAFIHRRYGIAMSPLHTKDDPMLLKFKVSGIV